MNFLWLIPLLPLVGAVLNGVFGKRLSRGAIGAIAAGSVGLSFAVSLTAFIQMLGIPEESLPIVQNYFTWIQAGSFQANAGLMLDHLSGLMILIVTGVGFLIHVYSTGYMHDDPGFYRYFAYLNLFMFSMLTLVLANNYLLMFVGWEGVGLCSYLLIGFWFKKQSATDAGKKAFIVNRIGDFGFILAALLIFWTFKSVDYVQVFSAAATMPADQLGMIGTLTAICLLMFVGATGKSAQIPLYVWLPDAMEGPTPVSALIHAATMVTAGVYMVARSAVLFDRAPGALLVVAVIGAATALIAASIALVQTDIKKVLAYSTVSQLGYMFLACGAGAYAAGVFHLMTHAFFKALLFLGAGSVIHGMGGIQDISKMGGLRREMPWTFRTFLIGTLAIAGVPGLAGFFSKDMILAATWHSPNFGKILWAVGLTVAGMTSFYMFRLLILTFTGSPRYSHHDVHHVHESPAPMLVPLVVLAFFSVVAGYVGLPPALTGSHEPIAEFLHFPAAPAVEGVEHASIALEWMLMSASVLAAGIGAYVAYLFYVLRPDLPGRVASGAASLYSILTNKYYVDEIYDAVLVAPIVVTSRQFLWKFVDMLMIDGMVNGIGQTVSSTANAFRQIHTGYVRAYAAWILFGSIVIVAWFLR
ncbi:MAG TPA: NADH-quinone oxidoreductase subunit L [Terriglobia bacterium]|nr:NADH-quinone oxidoreductase subunit L [Terriglobia bacterium]